MCPKVSPERTRHNASPALNLSQAGAGDGETTETGFVLTSGLVVLEYDGRGNETAYNVYGGDRIISRKTAQSTIYYVYNGHGDVVQLTNVNGNKVVEYDYDAFGNLKEAYADDTNPYRYCGEYFDVETQTYYLRARYYSPQTGRFTQQDTYLGQYTDPLSLNRYTYCSNNPLKYHDPSGHMPLFVGILPVISIIPTSSISPMVNAVTSNTGNSSSSSSSGSSSSSSSSSSTSSSGSSSSSSGASTTPSGQERSDLVQAMYDLYLSGYISGAEYAAYATNILGIVISDPSKNSSTTTSAKSTSVIGAGTGAIIPVVGSAGVGSITSYIKDIRTQKYNGVEYADIGEFFGDSKRLGYDIYTREITYYIDAHSLKITFSYDNATIGSDSIIKAKVSGYKGEDLGHVNILCTKDRHTYIDWVAYYQIVNTATSGGSGEAGQFASWTYPLETMHTEDPTTGARYFGAKREERAHAAIDLIVPHGTAVLAMTSGTVINYYLFYQNTYALEVLNDDGSIARYTEITSTLTAGTRVEQGQNIGTVITNNDGTSMLHIEIYAGTVSGGLTDYSSPTYTYVTQVNYQRRSDLLDPTFVKDLPMFGR